LPLQHRHIETTADFHPLPPVERDCRLIMGKYVQERNLASRHDLAGNRCQQRLRVTATAMIGMHADGRYLGLIGGLHPLTHHRNQPFIDPNSQKRSQFMRSQREGTGLGEFGQLHHRGSVTGVERDGFHAAD
jgi:hypothetical protein